MDINKQSLFYNISGARQQTQKNILSGVASLGFDIYVPELSFTFCLTFEKGMKDMILNLTKFDLKSSQLIQLLKYFYELFQLEYNRTRYPVNMSKMN